MVGFLSLCSQIALAGVVTGQVSLAPTAYIDFERVRPALAPAALVCYRGLAAHSRAFLGGAGAEAQNDAGVGLGICFREAGSRGRYSCFHAYLEAMWVLQQHAQATSELHTVSHLAPVLGMTGWSRSSRSRFVFGASLHADVASAVEIMVAGFTFGLIRVSIPNRVDMIGGDFQFGGKIGERLDLTGGLSYDVVVVADGLATGRFAIGPRLTYHF
jgi:hypothetical protein